MRNILINNEILYYSVNNTLIFSKKAHKKLSLTVKEKSLNFAALYEKVNISIFQFFRRHHRLLFEHDVAYFMCY